jgi:hypothetical protein
MNHHDVRSQLSKLFAMKRREMPPVNLMSKFIKEKFPVILAFGLIAIPMHAAGESLTVAWNANPEPDIISYRIYIGTESGQYSLYDETASGVELTVGSLQRGSTYYMAVSAVNSAGLEGPLSDELAVVIDTPPLPSGTRIATSVSNGQSLQWNFPLTDLGSSPEFIVYQSPDLVNWTIAEVVTADAFTSHDSESVSFNWPIQTTGERMFFRLSARNWLGYSASP